MFCPIKGKWYSERKMQVGSIARRALVQKEILKFANNALYVCVQIYTKVLQRAPNQGKLSST